MKKAFVLIGLIFVLNGCSIPSNPQESDADNQPKEYSVGDVIKCGNLNITLISFANINNICTLEISIKNSTSNSVDYSSMYSWGSLVCSDGTQLETVSYIGLDEFKGWHIYPNAIVTDYIRFERYYGSSNSFVFYATPPIDGAEDFIVKLTL